MRLGGKGTAQGLGEYRLLYHPQALDDANKGIINELKKTNYRDVLKEKKEKGKFLEPLRLQNSPFVFFVSVLTALSSSFSGPRGLTLSPSNVVSCLQQTRASSGAGVGGVLPAWGWGRSHATCPESPRLRFFI